MPFITPDGLEIRLDSEERDQLGQEFKTWVESVEDERRRLLHETWIRALENYEGKEPVKQFPWLGASNVVLPITPTHTDAIESRLYIAATAQDPILTVLPGGQGFVGNTEGFKATVEEYAKWWQNIAEWIASSEMPYKDLAEEIILTYVIYGDAFVYLPWETETVMDVRVDPDSPRGIIKEERVLWDKPMPKVLHPKDTYINWWEKDVQQAMRVGFRWDLDAPTIDLYEARGVYTSDVADELRGRLNQQVEDQKKNKAARGLAGFQGNYYQKWGNRYYSPDELERAMKEKAGIEEEASPNALKMVKVFARADLDHDGIPEEVVFDVERESGIVPYSRYANLEHKKRPMVQFYYNKRPGMIYNRGVPELLFNIQKILNSTMRDVMDNNKVQNTKMFLARKGSPIEKKAKAYPSRIFFVDNIEQDFKAVDLGTGKPVTSVQDIALIQQWGERLTGISDFNLGQERRSRTPVGTTMALLEEGNKRIDRTIEVMRGSFKELWSQILALYYQNGDGETLAKAAAVNATDVDRFLHLFDAISFDEFQEEITIRPKISSATLNKNTQLQKSLALFAQVDAYYERVTKMANAMGSAMQDPVMQQLFLLMTKGYHRSMKSVLDAFDVRDQEAMNPDMSKLVRGVTSVEVTGETQEGSSSPAQEAQGVVAGQGEQPGQLSQLGRPIAGGNRPVQSPPVE
jgi:hypothetical protein